MKFFSNKINNKNANFVGDNSNEKIEVNDLNCFSYIDENDEISIIDKTDFFSIDTSPAEISKLVENIIQFNKYNTSYQLFLTSGVNEVF